MVWKVKYQCYTFSGRVVQNTRLILALTKLDAEYYMSKALGECFEDQTKARVLSVTQYRGVLVPQEIDTTP